MTKTEFDLILKRPESDTLDFKRQGYDLAKGQNDFIKDILAMANTPREYDAYIVLGVQWTPEDGAKVIGLNQQYDDNAFQIKFGEDKVQPRPRFTYVPFNYDGKIVGILLIQVGNDGPYTLTRDIGSEDNKLNAGTVYYRCGSRNGIANALELRRVSDWFVVRDNTPRDEGINNGWKRFFCRSPKVLFKPSIRFGS